MIDCATYIKNNEYKFFRFILMLYFVPRYLEFTTFINYETLNSFFKISKLVSYILVIGLFLVKTYETKKLNIRHLLFIGLIIVFYIFMLFLNGSRTILIVLLFSLCFNEDNFAIYIKDILTFSVIFYLLTVVSCGAGLIENVVTSRDKFGGVWTAGGYGFEYSGQMIMMLIPIVMMYYYIKGEKIKLKDNILWLLITCLVYSKCKTIMGAFVIILFIVAFNIIKTNNILNSLLVNSRFISYAPLFFSVIALVLIVLYRQNTELGNALDVLVNGRLSVFSRVYDNYGIKMFGTGFVNNTLDGRYEIVDSEYLFMLVSDGIVYFLISLIICFSLIRYAQMKNDYILVLIWITVFFNAIFNNGIFGLVMNPFSILAVPSVEMLFKSAFSAEKEC